MNLLLKKILYFHFYVFRETTLKALRTITLKAGSKMSEAVRSSILEVLEDLLDSSEVSFLIVVVRSVTSCPLEQLDRLNSV